jgi:hypothetical protein
MTKCPAVPVPYKGTEGHCPQNRDINRDNKWDTTEKCSAF